MLEFDNINNMVVRYDVIDKYIQNNCQGTSISDFTE